MFALGLSRFISCAHWLLQIIDGDSFLLQAIGSGLWPLMVLASELVQTFILADFWCARAPAGDGRDARPGPRTALACMRACCVYPGRGSSGPVPQALPAGAAPAPALVRQRAGRPPVCCKACMRGLRLHRRSSGRGQAGRLSAVNPACGGCACTAARHAEGRRAQVRCRRAAITTSSRTRRARASSTWRPASSERARAAGAPQRAFWVRRAPRPERAGAGVGRGRALRAERAFVFLISCLA